MTQSIGAVRSLSRPKAGALRWRLDAGCILLFAAASIFFFRGAFVPHMTIEGADAALWVPEFVRRWTEYGFVPRWFPHFLAGFAQQFQFLSHGIILMLLAPAHKFHGFEFMLDIFLAGMFMFLFLRDIGLGRFGAVIGGLSYQLGNGLLTSARQGALWRLDTACWTPLFLLFFTRILTRRDGRLKNAFFAGITLGLQFLGGEVQLAYYVCLLALTYFLVDAAMKFRENREYPIRQKAGDILPRAGAAGFAVAIAVVFAAEVFLSYAEFARTNENVGAGSEQDNWKFATEFSFPPEETLSLMLTGDIFTTGARAAAGFSAQRITDDYLGILALLFAAIGLFSGRRHRIFFAAAACAALIIAFGKCFPLPYRLVYELPLMQGLRNPHKWLFITALCTAILAGMGADYWVNAPAQRTRRLIYIIVAFAALAAVATVLAPWAAQWSRRGGLSAAQLAHPALVLAAGSLLLILGRIGKREETGSAHLLIKGLLVVLLMGDLIFNAAKYVMYYNYHERYVEDGLAQFLRSQSEPFRVKLWSENPYLRSAMTDVLPYHGIDVVDAIMSRRPRAYSEVFQALREQRLPLRAYLQLFNVRYVLSAGPIAVDDIPLRPLQVFPSGDGGGREASVHLYEFADFLPRAYVAPGYVTTEHAEAIARLADADIDLRKTVVLEKAPNLPEKVEAQDEEFSWNVANYEDAPHRVSMDVSLSSPGILVLLDYADENWNARVDGQAAELLRANYLMRAVALPEGIHHVEFHFAPATAGFKLTLAGWFLLLALLTGGGIRLLLRARARQIVEGEA